MAKKKKRKYSVQAWEELTRQVAAQKQEAQAAPEPKAEPKVEIHIHNSVPAPSFGGPMNSADSDLKRLVDSGRMKI